MSTSLSSIIQAIENNDMPKLRRRLDRDRSQHESLLIQNIKERQRLQSELNQLRTQFARSEITDVQYQDGRNKILGQRVNDRTTHGTLQRCLDNIQELIRSKVNLNCVDPVSATTALELAADYQDEVVVKLLLRAGACPFPAKETLERKLVVLREEEHRVSSDTEMEPMKQQLQLTDLETNITSYDRILMNVNESVSQSLREIDRYRLEQHARVSPAVSEESISTVEREIIRITDPWVLEIIKELEKYLVEKPSFLSLKGSRDNQKLNRMVASQCLDEITSGKDPEDVFADILAKRQTLRESTKMGWLGNHIFSGKLNHIIRHVKEGRPMCGVGAALSK